MLLPKAGDESQWERRRNAEHCSSSLTGVTNSGRKSSAGPAADAVPALRIIEI